MNDKETPDGLVYQAFSERMLHKQRRLDLFAAAALQGFCSIPSLVDCNGAIVAGWAWEMARHMIDQEPK